jgi:formylmethanofuran dehydrogenase subunit E
MNKIKLDSVHLHTYERSRTNKRVYRCIDPDCSHFTAKDKLEGKRALCIGCGEPFIIPWRQLKNKHPKCEFCTKSSNLHEVKSDLESIISDAIDQED